MSRCLRPFPCLRLKRERLNVARIRFRSLDRLQDGGPPDYSVSPITPDQRYRSRCVRWSRPAGIPPRVPNRSDVRDTVGPARPARIPAAPSVRDLSECASLRSGPGFRTPQRPDEARKPCAISGQGCQLWPALPERRAGHFWQHQRRFWPLRPVNHRQGGRPASSRCPVCPRRQPGAALHWSDRSTGSFPDRRQRLWEAVQSCEAVLWVQGPSRAQERNPPQTHRPTRRHQFRYGG